VTVTQISLRLIADGRVTLAGRDRIQIGPYLYRVVGWSDDQALLLEPAGPEGFDPD